MARFDDDESAKKIRKAPQKILCGIAFTVLRPNRRS
jgi:hypothetical protein